MRPFVPPTQGYWLRITAKKKPTDLPEWQSGRTRAQIPPVLFRL